LSAYTEFEKLHFLPMAAWILTCGSLIDWSLQNAALGKLFSSHVILYNDILFSHMVAYGTVKIIEESK